MMNLILRRRRTRSKTRGPCGLMTGVRCISQKRVFVDCRGPRELIFSCVSISVCEYVVKRAKQNIILGCSVGSGGPQRIFRSFCERYTFIVKIIVSAQHFQGLKQD